MKNKNLLKTLLITATSSSIVIPCITLASCTKETKNDDKPVTKQILDFAATPNNINMDTSSVPLTIKSTGTYHMSWSLDKSDTETTTQSRAFWYRKWVNVEGEARWTNFIPWTKGTSLSFDENDVIQIVSGNPEAKSETDGGKFSTAGSIFKIKLGTSDDTCKISLGGNISSLLMQLADDGKGTKYPDTSVSPYENQYTDYNFQSLFEGSNNLFSVGANFLSYDQSSIGCYAKMFKNCVSLERAPILRAVRYKLGEGVSELLAPKAFESMFEGCTKLQTSPYLAARTLGVDCYKNMFKGCTSLNSISMAYVGNFRSEFFSGWTSGVNLEGNIYYDGLDTEERSTSYGIPKNFTVRSKSIDWKQNNLANILFTEDEEGFITDTKTKFAMYKDIPKTFLYNVDYVLPAHTAEKGKFSLLDTTNAKIDEDGSITDIPDAAGGYKVIKIAAQTKPTVTTDWTATNVEVKEATTLRYNNKQSGKKIQYRIYNQDTSTWGDWNDVSVSTTNPTILAANTLVQLQGNLDNTGWTNEEYTGIKFEGGEIVLRGKLQKLLYNDATIKSYSYCKLFMNSTAKITIDEGDHSEDQLLLPTKDIEGYALCYAYMFQNCTNLQNCPTLPATKLAPACYYNMFKDCSSIKTAPDLPASTLPAVWSKGNAYRGVYQQMFMGCTSLVNAPSELPAETVTSLAYYEMFGSCTSLKKPPIIRSANEEGWINALYPTLRGNYDSSPSAMSYMFYNTGIKVYSTAQTGLTSFYTCKLGTDKEFPPKDYNMFKDTKGGYTSNPSNNVTYYYLPY